jgi:hypothetical protein
MKKILLSLALAFCTSLLYAQGWTETGIGTNALNAYGEGIYTMCTDLHNNVYVAGWLFDSSGNNLVSKWDGTAWHHLGAGSSVLNRFMQIESICVDTSGNIYVGCELSTSPTGDTGYIAKWDGTSWSSIATGLNNVSSICIDKHNNVYAAGAFSGPDGYYVAKWDGSVLTEVGTGTHALHANNDINVIAVDTFDNIYAGGNFTDARDHYSGNIYVAKWDCVTWSELGHGVGPEDSSTSAQIFSILLDTSGNVYAAGNLDLFPSVNENVVKWDGTTWSNLGILNVNGAILTMCFDINRNLYAGGYFTDTTGQGYIAKWDGTAWNELGTGTNALNANGAIFGVCTDAIGNIYTGGFFTDTTTVYFDHANPANHPYYVAKYGAPTTGIKPVHTIAGLNIYPNPATNELNITGVQQSLNYRMYNITGTSIQEGVLNTGSNQIALGQYAPGIYVLDITNESGERNIVRVVKE